MAGTFPELMTEKFYRINFTPRTSIGRFDCECVPSRGVMTVETALYLNFMDEGLTDAQAFQTQLAQLVPQTWNNQFKFHCAKPGFAVDIKPTFRVRFESDFNESHYVVNVSDSIFGKEKVSRADYFKATGPYKPKTAQFGGMKALQPADFTGAIARELGDLFPFSVQFPIAGGALSAAMVATLQHLARQISQIDANMPVYLKAGGGMATTNMATVEHALTTGGCHRIVKRKRSFKYKHEVVVTLKDDVESRVPAVPPPSFAYPSTVVHEYGHMLGLTDEYNCLSKTAADKMSQLQLIDSSQQYAFEGLHAKGAQVMQNEFADSQREQIQLCREAGVAPPTFGFKSSSLMASGSDVQACHFVTLWQCLTEMMAGYTAPSDWKIVP
jgi:hypothetical protein